jgi:hypothetical protein
LQLKVVGNESELESSKIFKSFAQKMFLALRLPNKPPVPARKPSHEIQKNPKPYHYAPCNVVEIPKNEHEEKELIPSRPSCS